MVQYKMLPGHQLSTQVMLNISPKGYWDNYLEQDSQYWLGKFYEWKGELKIEHGQWEPIENLEDQSYITANPDIKFLKARKHFVEI